MEQFTVEELKARYGVAETKTTGGDIVGITLAVIFTLGVYAIIFIAYNVLQLNEVADFTSKL